MSTCNVFITLCLWTLVSGIKFGRELVSEDLDVLASYKGYRSSLKCATKFVDERRKNDDCLAYLFHSESRTCFIYKMGETNSSQSNLVVYKYYPRPPKCDTSNGFQQVMMDGRMFCYYFRKYFYVYKDARRHCQRLGGFLLHFDDESEIKAVNSVERNTVAFYWVGAKREGGRWVSEKDNEPLTSLWPSWRPGTFNGNCLKITKRGSSYVRYASTCNSAGSYICERST